MPPVVLPGNKPHPKAKTSYDVRSVVIVGANGSGKTRLGTFIELQAGAKAHRISAQRSLVVPKIIQPRPYEQAQKTLRYGVFEPAWEESTYAHIRVGRRWQSEPDTSMLDDYEHLLAFLFADEAKRNREYARAATSDVPTSPAPKCKLDTLRTIWASVLPHRQLEVTDATVNAQAVGGSVYQARHMSDGERVAFYLIGQALCAPDDGVIIIDEPEIHLHRAIQTPLWNQIEAARPDCSFVYITHDLEFASTRLDARRIWVKDFDGEAWSWEEIGSQSGMPDALVMEILGSRRPILFVEGDETSRDVSIYSALYPDYHVVPRQSCEKVIEATKAMRELPRFHHLTVRGLVDRDRRGDNEIAALKAGGVMVADVAEVENLLCIPEAIVAVASRLHRDPNEATADAQQAVFGELRKQLDHQALSRALADIQLRLNGFGPKIGRGDPTRLEAELNQHVKAIDVGASAAFAKALFEQVLATLDYAAALRFFNCKGIVSFVAKALGVNADVYAGIVIGVLKSDPAGVVAEAMRRLIGN